MKTNNIDSRIRSLASSIATNVAKKEAKKIRIANRYANLERAGWALASMAAGVAAGVVVHKFSEFCSKKILEVPDTFEIIDDPEMEIM